MRLMRSVGFFCINFFFLKRDREITFNSLKGFLDFVLAAITVQVHKEKNNNLKEKENPGS